MSAEQQSSNVVPVISADQNLPEINLRVILLGVILTIVLAATNAFLGLKVGVTVSASIPAAVISIGILRFFRDSNILQNTMVQIMASVGEALTAGIAFILPALLILHVWTDFNYWQTVIAGLLGGTLGVLFTIPLRRALLQDRTLRYPEAVAIANVLKASAKREKGDLNSLVFGGLVGGVIALFQSGFQILTDTLGYWFKSSTFVYGMGFGLSPALIAAGYIVGANVAVSSFVGVIIGWIAGIPLLSWHYGIADGTASQVASIMQKNYIRYIGIGTMLVGGLWTLCTLFQPVVQSMAKSFANLRAIRAGDRPENIRTESDIPIHYVFILTALLTIPIFYFMANSVIPAQLHLADSTRYLISAMCTAYILIGGFVFCSIMSYFAGLIGSTNSPVSGLLVSALLVFCILFMAIFRSFHWAPATQHMLGSVVAIGCMVVIASALSISNDTMQDLKVGQLVGATPWKQQVMLFLGVAVTSFVVPPILQLLYSAYGIGGVFPRAGMNPDQMLAAPQASMMATVAQAAFMHNLEWGMIGIGFVVAIVCIIIDEILKRNFNTRLPVLAVGLGIYLPLSATTPVIMGGFLSYFVNLKLNRRYPGHQATQEAAKNKHRHQGLLLCCGLVAGASLMGVILAIPFAIKQSSDALKIMPAAYSQYVSTMSIIATVLLCAWIYRVVIQPKKVK